MATVGRGVEGDKEERGEPGAEGSAGDVWHLDEVSLKIGGERHYLGRAADKAVRYGTDRCRLEEESIPSIADAV